MSIAPPILNTAPHERIRHPLERLSGIIRKYVAIDGALAVGLFLTAWFWIGMALDYGCFKLLAFDWVLELPHWFRGLMVATLSGLLVMLLMAKFVRRLMVDFRPAALALVLERRFPAILGDRLITSVELADLGQVERQGYSRMLVEDTIREAGERLDMVDIQQAFDWSRIWTHAKWLVALVVLPFVIFGAAYSGIRKTSPFDDYLPRFREVATIWAKRNLLLRDVIWPRKAYLEVLDFPASGELRIGRDSPSPRLRFKARRWMLADSAAPEGWRPMTWDDLRPGLLAGEQRPDLPTAWLETGMSGTRGSAARAAGLVAAPGLVPIIPDATSTAEIVWTLDEVELALEDQAVLKRLEQNVPDKLAAVRHVFELLSTHADDSGSRSVYRKLEVPDRIEVKYWGSQTSGKMDLLRGPGWEYAGTLGDLKESVKFRARGADYYTPTKAITLVPPPSLQQLKKIEYRPAYLYHRPPLGQATLKGLRQRVEDLAGLNSATTRISLPAGTDLVLEGQLDKELAAVTVRSRGKPGEGSSVRSIPVGLDGDALAFRHRIDAISQPLDIEFEFTDTDNVKSTRHVVVEAVRDLPPNVNVAIDGLRRNSQGHYLATPVAMIPFDGKIIDGMTGQLGGLDRIEYQASIARLETSSVAALRAEWLAGALFPAVGGKFDSWFIAAIAGGETSRIIDATAPAQLDRTFALETFQQLIRDRAAKDVSLEELQRRLAAPPGAIPLVREFVVQPQFEGLDLRERLPDLKVRGESEVQPRYRMKLTVVATDNNVETGPGTSANKEPPFTVMIVSEPELLVEVARDEEAQHVKMDDAVARLREVRTKLEAVAGELPMAAVPQLPTYVQRAVEMSDSTVKARDVVQEVLSEYTRILRELELNRVRATFIEKVRGEIVLPLESATKVEFVAVEEALEQYRKELEAGRKPDAKAAREALNKLIAKLEKVMAAMGELTDMNKLITALREIEKSQEQLIGVRLRELLKIQRQKIIDDLKKNKDLE